jgi:hypothetical protein
MYGIFGLGTPELVVIAIVAGIVLVSLFGCVSFTNVIFVNI